MTTQTKPLWHSKTFLGVAIMLLAPQLREFGIDVGAIIAEYLGPFLAVYGRASADRRVDGIL